MENAWITIGAALAGAIVGAAVTAWFTRVEEKEKAKREAAKAVIPFLSLISNRSAPDHQSANAADLKVDWAKLNRFLYFMRVPDHILLPLDERVVTYLRALEGLHHGSAERAEVERERELAKTQIRSFSKEMGI